MNPIEQSWRGHTSYRCPSCAFAHMSRVLVEEHVAARHEIDPGAGDALDALTVAELQEQADAAGLDVSGTGKAGRVLRSDLIGALTGAGG